MKDQAPQRKCIRSSAGWQLNVAGTTVWLFSGRCEPFAMGKTRSNGEKAFDSSPGINYWCVAKILRGIVPLVLALCENFCSAARCEKYVTQLDLASPMIWWQSVSHFIIQFFAKEKAKVNIISKPNLVKQALWQGLINHGENKNCFYFYSSIEEKRDIANSHHAY